MGAFRMGFSSDFSVEEVDSIDSRAEVLLLDVVELDVELSNDVLPMTDYSSPCYLWNATHFWLALYFFVFIMEKGKLDLRLIMEQYLL